jgi:rhamnogalacturonan endolyase
MTLKRNLEQLCCLIVLIINIGFVSAQHHSKTKMKVLFADDFKNDTKLWISEFEQAETSSMKINQGKLDVIATAGGTVWYKNKLQGNVMITYNATVVNVGGKNDRVSDMNTFWMATNPSSENINNQSGKFESYDNLHLYYAGIGGHDNETTRFRKYTGNGQKEILKEYTDKSHLLEGNKKYAIKIIVNNGLVQYFVDDNLFWEYKDASPYTEGYFGFRTYISHQIYEDFKVYQLHEEKTVSKDSIAMENDFVRVMKNATVKSANDAARFGKRIVVALSPVECKSTAGIKIVERGGIAVFNSEDSYSIQKGDYFEVAFKKNHPEPKGPEEWLEPLKNKIVYEDELFRVFEERLAPGDTRELHSHSQRIVVRLNKVQLTDPRFKPKGAPGEGIQAPNTVKFAEPMVHVVKNLSTDTPLFNIIIEFKTPIYNNKK